MENFGKRVRDKITGFTGVITARCDYMYGCTQYGVTPEVDKEGKLKDTAWFDKGRIEFLDTCAINAQDVQAEKPGCEFQSHPSSQHP